MEIGTEFLRVVAAALRPTRGSVELDVVGRLASSDRSSVLRLRVRGASGQSETVIVKVTAGDHVGDDNVREPAALSVLNGIEFKFAPRLLATNAEPPFVVLEDLGGGPSLADALLGSSRLRADEALDAWAGSLAALHASTTRVRPAFRRALEAESEYRGLAVPTPDATEAQMRLGIEALTTQLPRLGIHPPSAALEELRSIVEHLSGVRDAHALTSADTCPDNNVISSRGLHLIDFERAQFRHVAWDVAYLRVPWPTCWCSWDLADRPADRALGLWRTRVAADLPYVATADFDSDLALASVGWIVSSIALLLPGVLDGDDEPFPDLIGLTPSRRQRIEHRLAKLLGLATDLPAVRDLFDAVQPALRRRWGPDPLPLAPAYRSATD